MSERIDQLLDDVMNVIDDAVIDGATPPNLLKAARNSTALVLSWAANNASEFIVHEYKFHDISLFRHEHGWIIRRVRGPAWFFNPTTKAWDVSHRIGINLDEHAIADLEIAKDVARIAYKTPL